MFDCVEIVFVMISIIYISLSVKCMLMRIDGNVFGRIMLWYSVKLCML